VHDLLFRALYIFVIIELETRRIVHTAVTSSPTDAWVAQQLREATPWTEGPRYLIRDRDKKYGPEFASVARSTGIQELKTPYQAPKANAVCERWIGNIRRECLDHSIILHRNHLSRVVKAYVDYYNRSRPHQGIGQRIPARFGESNPAQSGRIIATPVLGGLHHSYSRIAYPN
jgi:putative transposase